MSDFNHNKVDEVLKRADRLFSAAEVNSTLREMAQEISAKLSGTNPVIVCIMNGGIVPFGIMLPEITIPCETDYVHATRYGGNLAGGELTWICGPNISPKGRTVLLVDDILDEGATLAAIERRYWDDGAVRVEKAVMVVKDRPRKTDVEIQYKGLVVPDRYVFGYGMDYKGYLRNAPGIFAEGKTK